MTADDPTAGLPPDLAKMLRDPSIIVPQDAAVFALIAEWMDAPSNTASAMTVEEWRDAWVYSTKRFRKAEAERDAALARLAAAETECVEYLNSGIACDCEEDCDGVLVVCFPHRILAVLVADPAAEETR